VPTSLRGEHGGHGGTGEQEGRGSVQPTGSRGTTGENESGSRQTGGSDWAFFRVRPSFVSGVAFFRVCPGVPLCRRRAWRRAVPGGRGGQPVQGLVLVAGVRAEPVCRATIERSARISRQPRRSRNGTDLRPSRRSRRNRRRNVRTAPRFRHSASASTPGLRQRVTISAAKMPSAMKAGSPAMSTVSCPYARSGRCRRSARPYARAAQLDDRRDRGVRVPGRGWSQSMSELPATCGSVGSSPSL
jgi:hypothetical protein